MKTFKQKVQAMTAKEIIMAMVDGLREPMTDVVDMSTFGHKSGGKCFGCAATNAICRIAGKMFKFDKYGDPLVESIDEDNLFVLRFEYAIDDLRSGFLNGYNSQASARGFAQIKEKPDLYLPHLSTQTYLQNLEPYIELANYQE